MKNLSKALFAIVATSAVSVGANAALFQNANGTGMTGQPYVGIKAGVYNVSPANNKVNNNNDNPTAYGIVGGYQYDANWGVEGEYVGTNKADMDYDSTLKITRTTTDTPPVTTTTDEKARVYSKLKGETIGLYGTYKYDFPNTAIYVKGKLGVAQNKIKMEPSYGILTTDNSKVSLSNSKNETVKESGLAGGAGVGYNLSPAVAVEAEYSVLPKIEGSQSDLITIGAKMKF